MTSDHSELGFQQSSHYAAKPHVQELDVLRGLAAVLMITNHFAVKLLTAEQNVSGITGFLFFCGSFAPVLFFFITGVGHGIQSYNKPKTQRWRSVLYKAGLLVLADLLMQWSQGRWLGLDFLGFIGLSMVVLEWIRLRQKPLIYCVTGCLALSVIRYLVAPLVGKLGHGSSVVPFDQVFGRAGITGISYPLLPWMVYPLLGFILGTATIRYWDTITAKRWRVFSSLAGIGMVNVLVGVALKLRGGTFMRWGTVSLEFYLVSFAAISLGMAGALLLCTSPALKQLRLALTLAGVSSLAIVPIHYFLIELLSATTLRGLNLITFCLLLLPVLTVSFLLARALESASKGLKQLKQQDILWLSLVGAIGVCSLITLLTGHETSLLPLLTRTGGQLLLCLLLAISRR